MIPLIIIILVIVLVIIVTIKDGYFDDEMLPVWLALCFIQLVIMAGVGMSHQTDRVDVERQNLAALSLDQTKGFSGGAIYLLGVGGGSVNSYEVDKYRYFAEDQEKGYKLDEAQTDNVYVKMDLKENEQPYLEKNTTVKTCENGTKIFPLTLWGINCLGEFGSKTEYIFHIPDGSLVNDYELDLKDL